MRSKQLIILTLFVLISTSFITFVYASNISGYAFLEDATQHDQIKIHFIAQSNSAVTTVTYSDINGHFSIELSNGLYKLEYSKEGYQPIKITESILISSNTTLNEVTLFSKPLKNISGSVFGTLFRDTTYNVVGNTNVPSDKSLYIQPGTKIEFDGHYKLSIYGELFCNGSKEDSIIFTSANETKSPGDWNGIHILGLKASFISYTIIAYGASLSNSTGSIHINGGSTLEINNCNIFESDYSGISIATNGTGIIENNQIYSNRYYSIRSDWDAKNVIINNNIIYDNGHSGILARENVIVTNNFVYNNVRGIYSYSNNKINNNILYNNSQGIAVAKDEPLISNNTLLYNTYGISLDYSNGFTPSAIVSNNIFYSNTDYGIRAQSNLYTPKVIEYNLFYNNGAIYNYDFTGLGQIITSNPNGTPADTHLNIFTDPNFYSLLPQSKFYAYLKPTSGAINAGDPSKTDSDGSILDIGAKFYSNFSPSDFNLNGSKINYFTYDSLRIGFTWNKSHDSDTIAKEVYYNLHILNNSSSIDNVNFLSDTVYTFDKLDILKQNESYMWTVISSDDLEFMPSSDSLEILIPNLPPSKVYLMSPTINTPVTDINNVVLHWEKNRDTDKILYSVHLKSQSVDTLLTGLNLNYLSIDEFIVPNTEYIWSVTASDGQLSTMSEVATFVTPNIPPDDFTLISPSGNKLLNTNMIEFIWTRSEDIDQVEYSLFLFDDSLDTVLLSTTDTIAVLDNISFLSPNSTFYWKVIATDGQDTTYSNVTSFITPNTPPTNFNLIVPANNEILVDIDSIRFSWSKSEDEDDVFYTFHLTTENKDTVITNINDTTLLFQNKDFFRSFDAYVWHINAYDNFDSTSSVNYQFKTGQVLSIDVQVDEIQLFPNPVIMYLNIINTPHQLKEIRIFNSKGELVYKQNILDHDSNYKIDLGKLPKGLYIVNLQFDSRNFLNKKILISH